MIQELYYTSAPRGLKAGSRGFCTVMCTAGMAKNLADRLEALSGYRHVFPPNDPNANLNPVAFSHLRITVGGQPYHVLSRICAAGLDYTQRSNKFAHHVIFEEKDLAASGPAALLAAPGFMESDWQGEPRILPAARKPPQLSVAPAICGQWQAIAGDAGWGGVLAETAANATQRNAVVIYRPGIDVLSLASEALALLQPKQRWQVTFSTFFTKLPPEVQCQWRFVLAGSPEAKALQRAPHIVTIDLSCALGRAPEGMWVDAARTGVAPQIPVAPQPEPKAAPQRSAAPMATIIESLPGISPAVSQNADNEWDSLAVLPPPVRPARDRGAARGIRGQRVVLLVCASMFAIALTAYTAWFAFKSHSPETVASLEDGDQKKEEASKEKGSQSNADREPSRSTEVPATEAQVDGPSDKETAEESNQLMPSPVPEPAADTGPGSSPPVPNTELVSRQKDVDLAGLPAEFDVGRDALDRQGSQSEFAIGPLSSASTEEIKLSIIGGETVLKDNWRLLIKPGTKSQSQAEFKVEAENPGAGQPGEPFTVASIVLRSDTLFFVRKNGLQQLRKQQARQLRNCILRVALNHGSGERLIKLRKSTHVPPIPVSFEKSPTNIPLDFSPWPESDSVALKLDVPAPTHPYTDYLIEPKSDLGIRLKSSAEYMPEFTLTLDRAKQSIEYRYAWQLLEKSRHPTQSLDSLRKELESKRDERDAKHKTLSKPAAGETTKQQSERLEEAQTVWGEVMVLDQQIAAVDRVRQLSQIPIHFSISMRPDAEHEVLVFHTHQAATGDGPQAF